MSLIASALQDFDEGQVVGAYIGVVYIDEFGERMLVTSAIGEDDVVREAAQEGVIHNLTDEEIEEAGLDFDEE